VTNHPLRDHSLALRITPSPAEKARQFRPDSQTGVHKLFAPTNPLFKRLQQTGAGSSRAIGIVGFFGVRGFPCLVGEMPNHLHRI
jgi:hypothetical protein